MGKGEAVQNPISHCFKVSQTLFFAQQCVRNESQRLSGSCVGSTGLPLLPHLTTGSSQQGIQCLLRKWLLWDPLWVWGCKGGSTGVWWWWERKTGAVLPEWWGKPFCSGWIHWQVNPSDLVAKLSLGCLSSTIQLCPILDPFSPPEKL